MFGKDIVVIDLETTGTLERTEPTRITSIGLARLDKDTFEIKDTFYRLINPQEKLTEFIVNYTNLTDERLKDQPTFKDLAETITNFIGGKSSIIAAWPLSFEQPILQYEYALAGLPYSLDRRGIDIGSLAMYYFYQRGIELKVHPDSKNNAFSLDNVSHTLGIVNTKRHDALEDAINEAKVLQYILINESKKKELLRDGCLDWMQKDVLASVMQSMTPEQMEELDKTARSMWGGQKIIQSGIENQLNMTKLKNNMDKGEV